MKSTKKHNERQHAKARAKERLGLTLNHVTYREVVNLIRNHHSIPVGKSSNRNHLHQVTYQGKTFVVVYDRIRGELVTVLPLSYLEGKVK